MCRSRSGMKGSLNVVVVEDDADYAFFIEQAFRNKGFANLVMICGDGEEAVDYLDGKGEFADREAFPFPDVLFTDLKMPRMNGFDLLKWIQAHPECALLPTVVLSSSADPKDVDHAYQLGADAFMVKPDRLETLEEILQTTCEFWAQCAEPAVPFKCPSVHEMQV